MPFKKKTSEPFGISQSICTRTLRNLTRYLHQNPPEPHQASSPPKPSGTSQGLCTGTFRNLTRYLPRNPPEPHRSLSRYLHRNPPEPHEVSAPEPSGTLSGLKLHRIAPELIWAKDPIAKFCCWRKTHRFWGVGVPRFLGKPIPFFCQKYYLAAPILAFPELCLAATSLRSCRTHGTT